MSIIRPDRFGTINVNALTAQPKAMDVDSESSPTQALLVKDLNFCYGGGVTFHTKAFSEPKLIDVNLTFEKGSRVIVAGANGAGKSTLFSIVGGQKMIL